MKILFIINQLRRSGPVNVLKDVISAMDLSVNDIYIFRMMDDDKDRSITSEFRKMNLTIKEFDYSFLQLELRTKKVAHELQSAIHEINPDVINTHGYHPALVASHFNNKIPRINTLHCISYEDYIMTYGRIQGIYMNYRYLKALKTFESCIAISDTVKSFYELRLNMSIHRVYNGIDTSCFRIVSSSHIMNLREEKFFDKNAKIFLAIGALSKRKNPDKLTEAFMQFLHRNPKVNAELVFVGKGELLDKCKEIAENETRIKFLGYRFDVSELLQCADYSVCASSSEGFGLNFIESLLTGIPVISSDIPPFKEFTTLCPKMQQFQCETNNVKQLSHKIELAYNSPKIDLSSEQSLLHKEFSSKSMSDGYLEVFRNLCNNIK